ncbi:MAG: EamA family transporter [Cytophagales bacterium]|nr:EamA family transporter [Armatimonadota bacterium]
MDSPSPSNLAKVPAIGLLLVAIASVQAGAALAVGLFRTLGPLGTVSLRVTLAAAILLLAWRPRFDREVRSSLPLLILFGLSIAGMNWCIYEAIARIPLGIAVTIEFAGPLAVAVATSRRSRDFVWIGFAVAGIALLTPLTGGRLDLLGVILALLAGACWGAYSLLGAKVGRVFPGGAGLAIGIAIAALALLPFGAWTAGRALWNHPSLLGVGLVVALASTVIPFSLEFEALRRLPARTYGVLVSLDPAAAAVAGLLILHQMPTLRTFAAIACVSVAAAGVTLTAQRDSRQSAPR